MEPSRAKLWTRRVVRGVLIVLLFAAIPYAVIGWRHMAMGDGLMLECRVTKGPEIPARTVLISVVDADGKPVPRGQVRLFHSSGSGLARLDENGRGSDTVGEPGIYDICFEPCDPRGVHRGRLPMWTSLFRHGGFSVVDQGARLDIRLRWAQAW